MDARLDFSTINIDELKKLDCINIPGNRQLQENPGSACAGDAPGYPSYFLRDLYTPAGNEPRVGPCQVIAYEAKLYVLRRAEDQYGDYDAYIAKQQDLLRKLWKPLPLEHERVQLWIRDSHRHLKHCYRDEEREEYGRPGVLIYPIPSYKIEKFRDDERFNDEWRAKEKVRIAAKNQAEEDRAVALATPENHLATHRIREFYPDYEPDLELIANPPSRVEGLWWETTAKRPLPEDCNPRSVGPHPVNSAWCQWCGWVAKEEATA